MYITLFGASLPVAIRLAQHFGEPTNMYTTASIKWGNLPRLHVTTSEVNTYGRAWADSAATARSALLHTYAKFDMLAFTEGCWFNSEFNYPTKNALRDSFVQINPGVQLGMYFPAMHVNYHQKMASDNYDACKAKLMELRSTQQDPAEPWVLSSYERIELQAAKPYPDKGWIYKNDWHYQWYTRMKPYLARTNQPDPETGLPDTAAAWMRNYSTNLLIPGCAEEAVAILKEFKTAQFGGMPMWLMIDFYSSPYPDFKMWQAPAYAANETGKMDLDQDGIAHEVDADEIAALKQAFIRLSRLLAQEMPELMLIPNGALPIQDPEVSAVVDGAFVEQFPWWHFGTGNSAGFANALNPAYKDSLWKLTAKGRFKRYPPVIILDDQARYGTLGAVALLYNGCVFGSRGSNPDVPCYLPIHTPTGLALGPAIARQDSVIREYENVRVIVKVNSNARITTSIKRKG